MLFGVITPDKNVIHDVYDTFQMLGEAPLEHLWSGRDSEQQSLEWIPPKRLIERAESGALFIQLDLPEALVYTLALGISETTS